MTEDEIIQLFRLIDQTKLRRNLNKLKPNELATVVLLLKKSQRTPAKTQPPLSK